MRAIIELVLFVTAVVSSFHIGKIHGERIAEEVDKELKKER